MTVGTTNIFFFSSCAHFLYSCKANQRVILVQKYKKIYTYVKIKIFFIRLYVTTRVFVTLIFLSKYKVEQ